MFTFCKVGVGRRNNNKGSIYFWMKQAKQMQTSTAQRRRKCTQQSIQYRRPATSRQSEDAPKKNPKDCAFLLKNLKITLQLSSALSAARSLYSWNLDGFVSKTIFTWD